MGEWDDFLACARYLFAGVLAARTDLAVEIGTASGLSTAYLCHGLDFAHRAGLIGSDWGVVSYENDIQADYYVDPSRRVGDATRGMLAPELLANHRHPWPALDLMATLDSLRPAAKVVLHDINLPVRLPQFAAWGAKHLFDDLDFDKDYDPVDPIPNIRSVTVPKDEERLRAQIVAVVAAHDWEATPPPGHAAPLLG